MIKVTLHQADPRLEFPLHLQHLSDAFIKNVLQLKQMTILDKGPCPGAPTETVWWLWGLNQ